MVPPASRTIEESASDNDPQLRLLGESNAVTAHLRVPTGLIADLVSLGEPLDRRLAVNHASIADR